MTPHRDVAKQQYIIRTAVLDSPSRLSHTQWVKLITSTTMKIELWKWMIDSKTVSLSGYFPPLLFKLTCRCKHQCGIGWVSFRSLLKFCWTSHQWNTKNTWGLSQVVSTAGGGGVYPARWHRPSPECQEIAKKTTRKEVNMERAEEVAVLSTWQWTLWWRGEGITKKNLRMFILVSSDGVTSCCQSTPSKPQEIFMADLSTYSGALLYACEWGGHAVDSLFITEKSTSVRSLPPMLVFWNDKSLSGHKQIPQNTKADHFSHSCRWHFGNSRSQTCLNVCPLFLRLCVYPAATIQ